MEKIDVGANLLLEHLVNESLDGNDYQISSKRFFIPTLDKREEQAVTLVEAEKPLPGENDYDCTLTFLIYCLDVSPDSEIAFIPKPKNTTIFGGNPVSVYDDHCTKQLLNKKEIYSYSKNQHYGIKGSVLGQSEDSQVIAEAGNIIRYSSSNFVLDRIESDLNISNGADLPIPIFCPIVTTNSSLYLLEHSINPKKLQEITSPVSISNEVSSLIFENEIDERDKRENNRLIQSLMNRHPDLDGRLNSLNLLLEEEIGEELIPNNSLGFATDIALAGDHFIFCNMDQLELEVGLIESLLKESLDSIKRFAQIKYDSEKERMSFHGLGRS